MSLKELLASWPEAPIVACKGCGRKIIFGELPEGGLVPLDPSPPVYRLDRELDPGNPWKTVKTPGHFISHFATCPKASQF
jgi:hypothetical protein